LRNSAYVVHRTPFSALKKRDFNATDDRVSAADVASFASTAMYVLRLDVAATTQLST